MDINKEFTNYIKLQLLLNRATAVLRTIFLKRWKQMEGEEWVNSEENANQFIGIHGKGYQIYEKSKSNVVKFTDFI